MQKNSITSQPNAKRIRRDTQWAWARTRVAFDKGQRAILGNQRLFPDQIEQLEHSLPVIRERIVSPIPIKSVREELSKLKRALNRADEICLEMPKRHSAGGEALSRLYQAAVQRNPLEVEVVTLQDLLKTANNLVECAIAGLPKSRGRRQRSSPLLNGSGELITPIVRALHTGHAAHYRRLANKQSVPKFDIRVARNNTRFSTIVGIVSDATGEWNVDEAIRAYLKNMEIIADEEKRIRRYWRTERGRAIKAHRLGEKSPKKSHRSPKTLSKACAKMPTTKVS